MIGVVVNLIGVVLSAAEMVKSFTWKVEISYSTRIVDLRIRPEKHGSSLEQFLKPTMLALKSRQVLLLGK